MHLDGNMAFIVPNLPQMVWKGCIVRATWFVFLLFLL